VVKDSVQYSSGTYKGETATPSIAGEERGGGHK
jgi:hypothetical protein